MSSVPTANVQGNQPPIADNTGDAPATESWQRQLSSAVRCPHELLRLLGIPESDWPAPAANLENFPLIVPHSFVARMQPGNPQDPLLRQVLPAAAESVLTPGFVADPVGDQNARSAPGLLQKYEGRALLITTGTCAVHCRYCFRREYPYQNDPRRIDDWHQALEQIAADTSISEVILSGGDPLVLSDERLERLCRFIEANPHIERIRIHTRLPIVLPARVTERLLGFLSSLRSQAVMVVHANHGNEIEGDCANALQRLVRSGIPVLNQAVLLRGVNDSVIALESLSRNLINIGVMPYYLHQLDRIQGAAHFEVSEERGLQLIDELSKLLPGYAVPKYVREVPGDSGKTPIRH